MFPDFLTVFTLITIFVNVDRLCQQYPTLSMTVYIMSILFFWHFMIFWLYSHWLPYLEMRTDHVSTAATLPITVHIMSILFFLIFPDFQAIFALITILGNVYRLCKHYPNIVNNSICQVYSFFLIFPNFLAIFALIAIFRNAHRPCNQCPNIITNSEHHPYFFLFD